ncbi:hypothetical protein LTR56_001080 [Elasticomyces elasticus]|nr:hypothetical protein LTR56_001080 [Elasticomyces elasticus]KAK3663481.1 hypothetical protein LTR22_005652 [Elasticomyces elasticus]KAK4927134.1 hypothetical protein LTR49_006050 [Elasticomyces elasticus]KAK5769002.1 hypothetical protein LTS12_000715 [Elasticomyces elasticus]
MGDSTTTSAPCDRCGKASAQEACDECTRSLEIDETLQVPSYCSSKCRDEAWPAHRDACLARKQVRRAGDLVKAAWKAWREETYENRVNYVRRVADDGKLHVYAAFGVDSMSGFPPHLQLSDPDKERLLAHFACLDAVCTSLPLVAGALLGSYTTLADVRVELPGSACQVTRHYANGTVDNREPWHELVRINCRDGMQYILDIAGGQYGQFRTILTRAVYNKQLEPTKWHSQPFGTRGCEAMDDTPLDREFQQARECFRVTVKRWADEQAEGVPQLLREGSESAFEIQWDRLIAEIRRDVGKVVRELQEGKSDCSEEVD